MKKLLNKVLFAGIFVQAIVGLSGVSAMVGNNEVAQEVRTDFIQALDENDSIFNCDRPFYFFKTLGKYPYMLKYHKGTNTLSLVMFASQDPETGAFIHIKGKAPLMELLVPVRLTDIFIDGNVKIDRKFAGYREPIGETLANGLRFIDFLPEHTYQGVPFVDEYKAQQPAKWVFGNTREYQAFMKYFKASFTGNNVQPLAEKPVLLIEIADREMDIRELDLSFVAQYYRIVSVGDNVAKAFYSECQKALFRAQDVLDNPRLTSQTAGEIIFGMLEKPMGEFKTKEFTAIVLGIIAGYLLIAPIKGKVNSYLASIKDELATATKIGCAAVTALIIYNVINKHVLSVKLEDKPKKKIKADEKLDAIVAQADRVVAAQA